MGPLFDLYLIKHGSRFAPQWSGVWNPSKESENSSIKNKTSSGLGISRYPKRKTEHASWCVIMIDNKINPK